jgi:hypothetical protein
MVNNCGGLVVRLVAIAAMLAVVCVGIPGAALAEDSGAKRHGPTVEVEHKRVGQCFGDAQEPDVVYSGPTFVEYVAIVAQQTCTGTFVLQRTCVKLQEWSFGTNTWADRSRLRCGFWTASAISVGSATFRCSHAGRGKYRTAGRGEVETTAGSDHTKGYSDAAWAC